MVETALSPTLHGMAGLALSTSVAVVNIIQAMAVDAFTACVGELVVQVTATAGGVCVGAQQCKASGFRVIKGCVDPGVGDMATTTVLTQA